MPSIQSAFNTAASSSSIAWLLWAVAIFENAEQRRKDEKAKADRKRKAEQQPPKPIVPPRF